MIGKTLGRYKVIDKIGEGGMGVVFRAQDTSLNRDVAIKILPADMSGDPERAARFEREARTLASLQHPNIASIYGYEKADGVRFLVMELVEGEDLSQRMSRGTVPQEEAIDIATQIAAGLEAAHEQGIVHRDLKPANVKLMPGGEVKVLDFGLARAYLGDVGSESSLEQSPTITAAMTAAGVILGTAAYMSPEQARGKRADKRTDLWAFGIILFEMLTGTRLFAGETVSDTMAAVLRAEPDFDLLPASTPASIRRLLRRCLQRDPRRRMRSAGDAILELTETQDVEVAARGRSAASRWSWVLVPVLVVLALILGLRLRPGGDGSSGVQRSLHLDIVLPTGLAIGTTPPSLSPDGRWLAFAVKDSLNRDVLYLRSLEQFGTELAGEIDLNNSFDVGALFWSPDSKQLGIVSGTVILIMDVATRITQKVIDDMAFARGASWAADGTILYAPGSNSGLFAMDSFDAEPRAITSIDTTRADASHRWPVFLPDGKRFLFTTWSNAADEQDEIGGIYLGALDGRPPVKILPDASQVLFDPNGFLLFHRKGNLVQVAFDADSGTVQGNASIVASDLTWDANTGSIMASASNTGDLVLATLPRASDNTLGWLDRNGDFTQIVKLEGDLFGLALAHNGRYAVLNRLTVGSSQEIWIADLERRTLSLLSHFGSDCWGGTFSPDSRRVVYTSQDPGFERLYVQAIDGATGPKPLIDLKSVGSEPAQWIDDQLLFWQRPRTASSQEMWVLDMASGDSRPLLANTFNQSRPRLSPDGHWLAYVSDESGNNEVYLRPYPGLDRKWQVSTAGGSRPHWNQKGTELLYFTTPGHIEAVRVTVVADDVEISDPYPLASFARNYRNITPDGDHQRFLCGMVDEESDIEPLRFISNWRASAKVHSQ